MAATGGKFGDSMSPGDIMEQFRRIKSRMHSLETARRLEGASIGRGGLRIHDGGQLVLDNVAGDRIFTAAPNGIFVHNGAQIAALDGGSIVARYPDGSTAAMWGSLIFVGTGEISGHGILVQDNLAGSGYDIFTAVRRPDGLKAVHIGEVDVAASTPIPVDEFTSESNYTSFRNYSSLGMWLEAFDEGNITLYAQDQGYVWLASDDFEVHIAHLTTGDSANCHIANDGRIFQVSSSIRHKRDVQDLEVDPDAVLRMRPRSWLPTEDVACGGQPPGSKQRRESIRVNHDKAQPRQVGFVAEELDEIGLSDFVTRDEQGQASSIRYDRLSAALLSLCQRQQTQIDDLSARVTALEATSSSKHSSSTG